MLRRDEGEKTMRDSHPLWGQVMSIDGYVLRNATEQEWRDSHALNQSMAMGGYIQITVHAVTENGPEQDIQVLACVIGGPNERYPE
jgi:hypothetical protein